MSNDIESRVKNVIATTLGVKEDEIAENSNFINDLGADSLDTVELVMALEQEFDCEIREEDAEKINTVKAAIDYIKEHYKA